MRTKPRSVIAVPADPVRPKSRGIILVTTPGTSTPSAHHKWASDSHRMANFTAWILRRKTGKRKRHSTNVILAGPSDKEVEHVDLSANMAQTNGIHREKTPVDTSVVPPGRVISTSMMKQGVHSSQERVGRTNGMQLASNRHLHQTRPSGLPR